MGTAQPTGVTNLTLQGHMTSSIHHSTNNMLFPIVSHWNRASILNRFPDIYIEIYRGNDLDLSGYVTSPVT